MKIERKRPGKTLPTKLAEGECFDRSFDGYHLVLRCFDSENREVRVILERHEAQRAADFFLHEVEKQNARVADIAKVADEVLG